ncbi:MAG: hypothetical protein BGN98_03885 [Microbacterium sp. 69-7]|uniref:hypothetical protein n=1 Tax=Microbacterium sp. 69-7 TaxID=1895784 RepID=UPI00096777ED|nr:hypothetical protein [Microbacterium sp. 69-7]OJU47384.1 MAG: hypothetical protein BGN98_03885 [Microbacterium sp. 69-7]
MNTTAQELAAQYAALPESIKDKCPRPIVDVTPERIRAWLLDVRTACLSAAASTVDLALSVARDDVQGADALRADGAKLLSFATQVGDLIGYGPRHTPYDQGTRLEPLVWVTDGITGQENPRPAEADDYGRVDFDDDAGITVATVHIEAEPDAAEAVYVMKVNVNAPVIIHGPGGEYIGTIHPM